MNRMMFLGAVAIVVGSVTTARAQSAILSSCRTTLNVEIRASEIVQCMQAMIDQMFSLQRENLALRREIDFLEQFGLPSGTVAIFDQECPVGWARYTPAAGRFVVGAGSGRRDEKGELLSVKEIGETGGAETHTLTSDEMPEHSHELKMSLAIGPSSQLYWANHPEAREEKIASDSSHGNPAVPTSGQGNPHNNMPPYIALNFCKKE